MNPKSELHHHHNYDILNMKRQSIDTFTMNIRYLHDYVIQGLLNVSARLGKMVARKNFNFWK